ncbi:Rhodanese-like and DUF2892 domain-containing protein [Candidatus Bealeia paramacronuclearis]|uniref:Rhodanese-like and DUF2892 domain-containing protein n=1 Tax=Candidatus Bealeia paramacronuclearis TaxID=1921001 RepID=A0ABZ2C2F7_9PROT|nr:hypothetical protein [Candidatus Bealeia paramacronuclearis]
MKTITSDELKKRLKYAEVVLIDVREPGEHKSECIEGAHLIPLSEICIKKLPTSLLPIVIHCRSGKRSQEACKKLLAENPNLEIYTLEGGISAWKELGGEVKTQGRNVLPLDRQVQVAVGFLAFSGVMLGTFVNSGFYVIPGFIGLGLVFAGLTGWCGMAKILAKMPWNQ